MECEALLPRIKALLTASDLIGRNRWITLKTAAFTISYASANCKASVLKAVRVSLFHKEIGVDSSSGHLKLTDK